MADSNSDKQSIDISQEIKNIILSISENDYTEEEAYAVRNYKDCIRFRDNSLKKFEILKSNNSDFYDIQKEFNKACIYSSSIRYYEKNEHIKAIVKREKEKPDYLYKFKEPSSIFCLDSKTENVSDSKDENIKPSIPKSILIAIISLIVFGIADIIGVVIFSLIYGLLLEIPIINDILIWSFNMVNGSPVDATLIFSTVIAYFALGFCADKLTKNEKTALLAKKIGCIFIIGLNILSLLINIFYGDNIFANIITALYGIAFLHVTKE